MSIHSKKRFFWGILIVITAFICGLLDYTASNATPFARSGVVKEIISVTTTADELKAIQARLKEHGITMIIKEVKYTRKNTVSSINIAVNDHAGESGSYSAKDMSKIGYFDIVFDLGQHSMRLGKEEILK